MTPLRQKMIRAMDLKNLSPHTRRSYLNAVTGLAKHYRQSPETTTEEMIEDYLLYLKNCPNFQFMTILNQRKWVTLR